MSPELLILLSGSLIFGVPLLLAVWELLTLRRGGDGPRKRDHVPDAPPAPGPAGGVRPLPDCLIPKPLPASAVRPREVEHA
jgi:hypothetical protein